MKRPNWQRTASTLLVVAVFVCGFIIVRPRLWVKNKTAKVIYDGRLSEKVKLFHGSDGRLLFYLGDDSTAYYYSGQTGLLHCGRSDFISLKLIAVSAHAEASCRAEGTSAVLGNQSLDFARGGQHISISWQAAPR